VIESQLSVGILVITLLGSSEAARDILYAFPGCSGGGDMELPSFEEYAAMLRRLENTMAWVSEEVENLATGVDQGLKENADDIATRLRDLAHCVFFRVGHDDNDPVPKDLPDIASTPTPDVGGGQRPLANFPRNP